MRLETRFQRASDKKDFSTIKVFRILHVDQNNYTALVDFDGPDFWGPNHFTDDGLEVQPLSRAFIEDIKNASLSTDSLFCDGMLMYRFGG